MASENAAYPLDSRRPGSLSRDEIINALKTAPKLQETSDSSVARISDTLVVKYGPKVHMWEARNMMFAASIPGVRLPKVNDAWEVEEDSPDDERQATTYILMDFIPGECLTDIWSSLTSEKRLEVYRQICDMLGALHQQTLGRPGPVGGGRSNGFYFTEYGAGPFDSRHDMEKWLNGRLQVCKDFGRALQDVPDFTGQFDNLVMCHTDLHTHNIILDAQSQVWLLDWDFSGAYPVFFEEASLKVGVDREHQDFIEGLLNTMSTEEHSKEIQQLDSIGFAVTTGAFCEPSKQLSTAA